MKEARRESERNDSFLHEYEALIGHCAFSGAGARAAAAAAADAGSLVKIGFETRGKFPALK